MDALVSDEQQIERTAEHLHRELSEWTESYFLIARDPITGRSIVRYHAPSPEHAEDLMAQLAGVVAIGGVRYEG